MTLNNIPNITIRLIQTKFIGILDYILKNEMFRKVIAYVYTIEFQKRDLPHAYLLITLHFEKKIITFKQVDSLIFYVKIKF